MTLTDIKSDGWIARFLPPVLRPYAVLARLDRPVGIWLLLLPGWWAIALAAGDLFSPNRHDMTQFVLFGIGAVVMRAAGCVINDLWDRRLDAQVARTKDRPLAAGTVRPGQAIVFLVLLLLAGLGVLLATESKVTILLGFLTLPLIASYPLMKRITWWPQLFLGITFNFGALMGWAAVTGVVGLPALLLYAAGIFWTLGYDTIYAHQDREDDMRIGIKSTALRFGARSKLYVTWFYAASFVLIAAAFVAAQAGWFSVLLLPAAGFHLWRQMKDWNPDDAISSLATFRANRDFGLLVLLAAAV